MHQPFLRIAAFLGALSVILGAFGAHSLKQILFPENLQIFETGVRYQFYHVFALIVVAVLFKEYGGTKLKWAGYCFITGIILFSGSLYALCFIKQNNLTMQWVGAITPAGGIAFISGWILTGMAIIKKIY